MAGPDPSEVAAAGLRVIAGGLLSLALSIGSTILVDLLLRLL